MDFRTWAPFQSVLVRQICEHMNDEEKDKVAQYGAKNGLIAAVFIVIPIAFSMSFGASYELFTNHKWLWLILVIWIAFGSVLLIRRRKKAKELLYSTQWAKQMGYKLETLKKK